MRKSILFILSFFIFFGCNEPEKIITKSDDLKNSSIGAMTGTTGEQLVKEKFPEAAIKSFDDIMDAVVSLKTGQLEAVITGYPTAMNVCRHNPDITFLPERIAFENTCMAVRKGNDKLLDEINEFIKVVKSDGTLDDMKRRWYKEDLTPYEEVEFSVPLTGEVLKVGTSATREPGCFINAKGIVSGHEGELAHRLAVYLNRPIQFFDMKFAALIPALQSGKIDIICAGMTATEERSKSVNFTNSYFENSQVLLVKKAGTAIPPSGEVSLNLRTPDDLKDKRIAVLMGSIHDEYAFRNYPNALIQQFKTPPELILSVKTGKTDAAIFVTELLHEIIRHDDALTIWGDPLFNVSIGMAFKKNNDELKEKFNDFIKQVKKDGTIDDMYNRWVLNGIVEMPQIKRSAVNGSITVGTMTDKGLPFNAVINNKMVGFDVELIERFGASQGKEIKWMDMEFGSIIMAAASGKVDIGAGTFMITEERARQVDFSDTYMNLSASILVLKKNLAGYNLTTGTGKSFLEEIAESFHDNIISEDRYLLIVDGLKTTAVISILSIMFGTLLGGIICFMRMSHRKILTLPAKFYISILRGTPVVVLLLIIFYIVFASVDIDAVLVAVIAFGLNFAAYVSEMFRTSIESIDRGQSEAAKALGFSKLKAFLYIILPQAVRRVLPVYKGEVISLVKMTSVVGYVAVQDLTKASDIIRGRTFDAFFPLIMIAILYFLISWLLISMLGYFERRTEKRRVREFGSAGVRA